MLDRRFIREHADDVRAMLAKRHTPFDLDALLALDARLLELGRERDDLKAEQNRLSKSVPTLDGDEKAAAIARSKELGGAIKPSGDAARTLTALGRAVTVAPRLVEAHRNIGVQRADLADMAGARAAYQTALMLSPDDTGQ